MKFTKEQAVEKLNQELTNGGKKTLRMSARTLEAQAENLMALVGDEEMELDAFVEKVKPMLDSMNANIEHDNSEFIKEYKKNHPEQKPDVKPDTKPDQDDPNKELREQVAEMRRMLEERDEKEALDAKRAEIRKYLKDNNVDDEKWIDSALSIATIGKDDNAEDKGKVFLDLYNKSKATGSPITPKSPISGGDQPNDQFADVRAILESEQGAGQGK